MIKKIIEGGNLVPDELITHLIKKKIKNKPHFMLDGFPRTLQQAELMQDVAVDKVLFLEVSEKMIIERLSGRRVCEQGIHNYHIGYVPPQKKDICDVDKTPLHQREDDNPAAIKERLNTYHQKTKPLIEYYTKKGILLTIKADGKPEVVYKEVKKVLENLN